MFFRGEGGGGRERGLIPKRRLDTEPSTSSALVVARSIVAAMSLSSKELALVKVVRILDC